MSKEVIVDQETIRMLVLSLTQRFESAKVNPSKFDPKHLSAVYLAAAIGYIEHSYVPPELGDSWREEMHEHMEAGKTLAEWDEKDFEAMDEAKKGMN
jgi:hypothetical protein